MKIYPISKICLAHSAPAFLDVDQTVNKITSIINEASRNGANIVAFPEAFLPGFPIWCALKSPTENHNFFKLLAQNSVYIDGPEISGICKIAEEHEIIVSLGFNELSKNSIGCIWNSNIIIGNTDTILSHHRKISPTFYEKLVWAPGDGSGLQVHETDIGKLGMLICGENTNPLARYSLLAQGEQIHISTYPPVWPTHYPYSNTNYDLKSAIEIRAKAHSFEGKLFNLVCSGFLDNKTIEILANDNMALVKYLEEVPNGISMVTDPNGETISDILQNEEGLLYCELDISECVIPKQYHDVVGGYQRFDIFDLRVNRTPQNPIQFQNHKENGQNTLS